MDLMHFRMRLADGLIHCGNSVLKKKRGRPSNSPTANHIVKKYRGEIRPKFSSMELTTCLCMMIAKYRVDANFLNILVNPE